METNETLDAVPADTTGEASNPRASFDAELAALRAEEAAQSAPATDFSEALEAEGIDVEVKPKPVAEPAAEDAPEEPEDDGMDALLEAAQPGDIRSEKLAKREAIQKRANELGLPPSLVKAMGANVKPEEAESYLDSLASKVQSDAAGQTTATVEPPAGILPGSALSSEVLADIESEAGEATARAVAQIAQYAAAEAHEAKALAMQGAKEVHDRTQRAEWNEAAGELSGRFQGLVRESGKIDPVVGQYAAALYFSGPLKGNKKASLEAAAKIHLTESTSGARQSATATPQPSTPTNSVGLDVPRDKPISGRDRQQLFVAIERKHANEPAKLAAAYERTERLIAQHNARLKK